jgi:hypothetical protein
MGGCDVINFDDGRKIPTDNGGGVDPELVAAELGLSLDSVYAAKSRVLKRLRQEAKMLQLEHQKSLGHALIKTGGMKRVSR